jgi:hypothetical protein
VDPWTQCVQGSSQFRGVHPDLHLFCPLCEWEPCPDWDVHVMWLQKLPGNLDQNVEEVLKEVDKNNDGDIDYEEFCEMMRNMQSSQIKRTATNYRKGAIL